VLLAIVIVGFIYHTGHFVHADVNFRCGVLAGIVGRAAGIDLGTAVFFGLYALRDTRTPLRFAVLRVALTLGLGYLCALPLPRLLGLDQRGGPRG